MGTPEKALSLGHRNGRCVLACPVAYGSIHHSSSRSLRVSQRSIAASSCPPSRQARVFFFFFIAVTDFVRASPVTSRRVRSRAFVSGPGFRRGRAFAAKVAPPCVGTRARVYSPQPIGVRQRGNVASKNAFIFFSVRFLRHRIVNFSIFIAHRRTRRRDPFCREKR